MQLAGHYVYAVRIHDYFLYLDGSANTVGIVMYMQLARCYRAEVYSLYIVCAIFGGNW